MGDRLCDNCRFCLLEDWGYSNYTTEGTYVHCLKGKHPDSGFDRFYGEDERLKFAQSCDDFGEGDPVTVDCDREGVARGDPLSTGYTTDPEIGRLLDDWDNKL